MPKSIAKDRKRPYAEIARENIVIGQCLANVAWVEQEILQNYEKVDLAQVPALKLFADIQFRKLAKVLPDLKQTDAHVTHQGKVEFKWNP